MTSVTSTAVKALDGDTGKRGEVDGLLYRGSADRPVPLLSIPDVLSGKAPYQHIPFLKQVYFWIRAVYVMLVVEFPPLWGILLHGSRNDRADVEGPVYVGGAPDRQIAEGKALIASREDMEANPPYLLTIHVQAPSGKPLPYAKIDFWQATSDGWYYGATYRLRGVFHADADGKCEILGVIPGAYGFGKVNEDDGSLLRAGHFHLRISTPEDTKEKNLEMLTTQLYVCRKNNSKDMDKDFVNYLRTKRTQNMLHSWATPAFSPSSAAPAYAAYATKYSFPSVPSTDNATQKSIDWWNALLADQFPGKEQLKVLAGGETTFKLNKEPPFYFF